MIDKSTIGVLYETVGGLIFEKINVDDVLKTALSNLRHSPENKQQERSGIGLWEFAEIW
jgi:hypothetical protein